ncbi:MAG: DUF4230 domain-containing protein [Anaerolineae bacterium]|jgi:hypothetical protein
MGLLSRLKSVLLILVVLGLVVLALWWSVRLRNQRQEPGRSIAEQLEARRDLTPTILPNPATVIRHVQSLSRLETAFYSIEKVITAETGQDALAFLFGDRLLFIAHGQVIAGVDLGQVEERDITITQDNEVVMILPPAEIFVATLDNDKSFVYDRETGLLGLNQDLETDARRAAEEEILNAALEDGILEMAEANARLYLDQLITSLGFEEVVFIGATATPAPPTLPATVVLATPTP